MSVTARLTARTLAVVLAALLPLAFAAAPSGAQELPLPTDQLPIPIPPGEEEPPPPEEDFEFEDDGEFDDGGFDEGATLAEEPQVTVVPAGGVAAGGGGNALPPLALASGLLLSLVGAFGALALRRPALALARR